MREEERRYLQKDYCSTSQFYALFLSVLRIKMPSLNLSENYGSIKNIYLLLVGLNISCSQIFCDKIPTSNLVKWTLSLLFSIPRTPETSFLDRLPNVIYIIALKLFRTDWFKSSSTWSGLRSSRHWETMVARPRKYYFSAPRASLWPKSMDGARDPELHCFLP